MKPIVELISEWDTFQNRHTQVSVEEFCKYYLAKKKEENGSGELFGGMAPPDIDTILAKIIGRIGAMHIAYSKLALKEVKEIEFEWFFFMNAIFHQGEAKKTDIIAYNFFEQSTGNDILSRIKKAGLIMEREAPNDKRARLIKLTAEGEKILFSLYELLYKPTYLMFSEIPDDDKQLIVKLLSDTEIRHGKILSENRNKNLDELLEKSFGKEKTIEVYEQLKGRINRFKQSRQII